MSEELDWEDLKKNLDPYQFAKLVLINRQIKGLHKECDTLRSLIAWIEAKQPSLEYNTRVEEKVVKAVNAAMDGKDIIFDVPKKLPKSNLKNDTETTEGASISPPKNIIQDLDGIMVLDKLPRSYLVAKGGYTAIVAYSHLKSGDSIVKGFQGNLNDDLHEDRKWILKTKKDGTPNLEWRPIGKGG